MPLIGSLGAGSIRGLGGLLKIASSGGGSAAITLVTSGLVLYLDSRDVTSWPGSGTTWYDLSGNSKNATFYNNTSKLNNSPGVVSDGTAIDGSTLAKNVEGDFYFNGTVASNVYQYAAGPNLGTSISQWTASVWFNAKSFSANGAYPAFFTGVYTGGGTGQQTTVNFDIGLNNSFVGGTATGTDVYVGFFDGSWHTTSSVTLSTATWYNVTAVYNGTTLNWYINGVAQTPLNYSSTTMTSSIGYRVARRWDFYDTVDAYVPVVLCYNRTLSSTEVTQNYQALQGRYGGVTAGLTFSYKMSNTASWKGKPTTNLHTLPRAMSSWSIQTYASVTANASADVFGSLTADRYIFNGTANAANQVYLQNVTPTANLTYTSSAYFKYVSGDTKINFSAFTYGTPQEWKGVTITYTSSTTLTLTSYGTISNPGYSYISNGWFRVWFSWSQSAVTGAVEFNINRVINGGISSYAATSWDICCCQLEQNTFASPFVDTSRTNTQAVIDLTGANTVTANSLTYNTDGTFSFNGSNNYIDINSATLISGTDPYTIQARYTTVSSVGAIFGNYGTSYMANTIWFFAGGLYFNGAYYITNYSSRISGTHTICVTKDTGGSIKVYFDGVLEISGSNTTAISTNQNYRIGADVNGGAEPFNGTIHGVQIYNRALSAAEVLQNYNNP